MGKIWCDFDHNELVFTFVGSCIRLCQFWSKSIKNATVRVCTDGYTDTLTDANRFYNLSHARCYSYGADKYAC